MTSRKIYPQCGMVFPKGSAQHRSCAFLSVQFFYLWILLVAAADAGAVDAAVAAAGAAAAVHFF